jgi:hypothetical protein
MTDQLLLWESERPQPRDLTCTCCGAASPNEFLADLNHYIGADGICTSLRLRRMQGRA